MRLIITFLMAWCLSLGAYAATAPDAKQLTQELEQAKAAKPAQPETVEALQSALNALEERKGSLERAQQYQQVIDNFPKLFQTLRSQINNLADEPRQVSTSLSTDALNQEILQVSSQLLEASRQAQQEQERARDIALLEPACILPVVFIAAAGAFFHVALRLRLINDIPF